MPVLTSADRTWIARLRTTERRKSIYPSNNRPSCFRNLQASKLKVRVRFSSPAPPKILVSTVLFAALRPDCRSGRTCQIRQALPAG